MLGDEDLKGAGSNAFLDEEKLQLRTIMRPLHLLLPRPLHLPLLKITSIKLVNIVTKFLSIIQMSLKTLGQIFITKN